MLSFGYRANALLTFGVTILAFMCAIASFSDNLNSPTPTAQVQVLNINCFQRKPDGDDEVSTTLNISANLQSLFTWNTKQGLTLILLAWMLGKSFLFGRYFKSEKQQIASIVVTWITVALFAIVTHSIERYSKTIMRLHQLAIA